MSLKIELLYKDPHFNGSMMYTVTAVEVKSRCEFAKRRLNVADPAERMAFGNAVAEATGFPELADKVSEELATVAASGAAPRSGAKLTNLADVHPKPVEWLWDEVIALGKLTLLCGDPGLGKSFVTIDISARVTTGSPMPGTNAGRGAAASVILISAEDGLDDTIRPRLDRAGADVRRVNAIEGVERPGKDGKSVVRGFTLADVPDLEDAIERTPGVRLVVIDPVSAYLSGSDSHNNAEIRGLLAPLAALAAKHNVAVVMVTHLSKGGGTNATYRAMGSLAFAAAARAVWLVVKDNNNEHRRLFLPVKNNLGRDSGGLAYSLVDGAVSWEKQPVNLRADEALAAVSAPPDDRRPERDEASRFLQTILTDCPKSASKVFDEAKSAGIAKATLNRAKQALGVISERKSVGKDGAGEWFWALPAQDRGQGPLTPTSVNTLQNVEYLAGYSANSGVSDQSAATGIQQGAHASGVSTLVGADAPAPASQGWEGGTL